MGFFNHGNNGKDKDTASEIEAMALRESYDVMTRLPAWDDFTKKMESVKESPIQILDQTVLSELTIGHAAFIKGVRAGIVTLEKQVNYILRGGTPNG
jgi:hypothetical protein